MQLFQSVLHFVHLDSPGDHRFGVSLAQCTRMQSMVTSDDLWNWYCASLLFRGRFLDFFRGCPQLYLELGKRF